MDRIQSTEILRSDLYKTTKRFEILKLLRVIVISILVFYTLTNTAVKVTIIRGDSMYPTLKDGDIAFTNVLAKYIETFERFDIVTIYSEQEETYIVKRIVGLPNETIEYKQNKLYINGTYIKEDYFDELYIDENTNGNKTNFTEDFGPITLKSDEYFVLGDNRRISLDSRKYGPFELDDIVSSGVMKILK